MGSGFTRRRFLALAGGGYAALVLTGCGKGVSPVSASSPAVVEAERRRRKAGAAVTELALTAAPFTLDLAGTPVQTWAYNGAVPGPEVRLKAGDVLRARFVNDLPDEAVVHWHGIALRNDMDGVPGVTQEGVMPGKSFTYEFTVPDAGSYWFHPHNGLQLDQGLYVPLVIEDPAEPGAYDREITVVLDDWVSGIGPTPEETLKELQGGAMQMGGMQMAQSKLLGGDAGDVMYPMFLMNGRPPDDPPSFDAKPGERIRLRLINAGAETAFRVALGGHRLTVTHTDGLPVEPLTVDSVLIGMSERYDVVVTVGGSGAFPLVALAEGKDGQCRGIVRSGPGDAPAADARPAELDGRLLGLSELRAAAAVTLPDRAPDRTYTLTLNAADEGYQWTINGKAVFERQKVREQTTPLAVTQGERVRLVFDNKSTMFHPMHLHGHSFQVVAADGQAGPRKDSMIVRPKERIAVDVAADNPGQWLLHCHNVYHQVAGMVTLLSYES